MSLLLLQQLAMSLVSYQRVASLSLSLSLSLSPNCWDESHAVKRNYHVEHM